MGALIVFVGIAATLKALVTIILEIMLGDDIDD
jgi:hypothetical protein